MTEQNTSRYELEFRRTLEERLCVTVDLTPLQRKLLQYNKPFDPIEGGLSSYSHPASDMMMAIILSCAEADSDAEWTIDGGNGLPELTNIIDLSPQAKPGEEAPLVTVASYYWEQLVRLRLQRFVIIVRLEDGGVKGAVCLATDIAHAKKRYFESFPKETFTFIAIYPAPRDPTTNVFVELEELDPE